MRHRAIFYHEPVAVLNADVAELLGLHAGDGWLSTEWGLALNIADTDMTEHVRGLIRRVLGVEPYVSRKSDKSISVRSGQAQVIQFFREYGFQLGKKSRIVAVPAAVLQSSDPTVIRAFLRGLFSADGCFTHRGRSGSCYFSVASVKLRDGFVTLASKVGIQFRCYSNSNASGKNKVPLRTAHIGKRVDVMRWMDEIGSECDAHAKRFREWRELVLQPRNALGTRESAAGARG